MKKDKDVEAFSSQSPFIRSTLSPVALCGLITEEVFKTKVESHMRTYVETWLKLVKDAKGVAPTHDVAALQARDYAWRKNLTDLVPANVFADKACGVEMRKKLVRCLQGADRAIPSKLAAPSSAGNGLLSGCTLQ